MDSFIKASLTGAQSALDAFINRPDTYQQITAAAQVLIDTFENNGTVIACGNGGSSCDAMHFAQELTGYYQKDRRAFPAIAVCNPGHITCVGNDTGYVDVFERFLQGFNQPGNCLLGISTSGTSKNVVKAAQYAKQNGIKVISLTGEPNSVLGQLADVDIYTIDKKIFADRVQEIHIKIIHILIELIERHFCPENYA